MSEIISRRYAGLIGLGLMFMWGSALAHWVELWNSGHAGMKILGFMGFCLESACGAATFLYGNSLEEELKRLKEQDDLNRSEMLFWKRHAQLALSKLEGNVPESSISLSCCRIKR